jgi:hypothetical protein
VERLPELAAAGTDKESKRRGQREAAPFRILNKSQIPRCSAPNPKFQAPNPKQILISKFKIQNRFEYLRFEF